MLMANTSFAQTFSNIPINDITLGDLTLEATQITTLPAWYREARDNVITDLEKRYHHYSNDHGNYLRIDSHDNNQFLFVESTKEALNLFFEANSGRTIFVASCNKGVSSIKWSYDNQYFCYQETTAANDDFILGSLHIGRVEDNELTDNITLIENNSITETCWDLATEKLAFTDFHRLFIYFVQENKLYEVKTVWTNYPEGYPQRLDKLAFSLDGNYLIFRYRESYWGDTSVYYQVKFP